MAALWRGYEWAMCAGGGEAHSNGEEYAKPIHRKLWILRGL
jgi:hypothetical protein